MNSDERPNSKLVFWTAKLFAGLIIAAVSIFGTMVWAAFHQDDAPASPLTAGLQGEWGVISQEFDRRVKADFALGSSETAMATELRHQGFTREDWGSSIDQEHEAMRREDNVVCRRAARVYWHANGGGNLTAIRGGYEVEGCL
ncbi:MAG: hypothetical protein WCC64_20230 [Aliidongia sp.]